MGLFSNLTQDQIQNIMGYAGAAQGFGQAAMPTRVPTPFGAVLAQGAAGVGQGIQNAQTYQAGNMANQQTALNLDTAKTLHPYVLQNIKNMMSGNSSSSVSPRGGVGGGGLTQAQSYGGQALMSAYASGDPKAISTAFLSLYEHSPELAGAIKQNQEQKTPQKMPDGTYQLGGGAFNGSSNAPPSPAPPSRPTPQSPGIMPNGQPDNAEIKPQNLDDLLNSQAIKKNPNAGAMPLAGDGKPIIPNSSNLFTPDPGGIPKYNTPNTDTGVAQNKLFQTSDDKANTAFTSNEQTFQNERFRLSELSSIYKQVQAGSLTAQNPDLMNKLVAWHVIDKPSDVKDLAGVQTALQNHALQIIQQIKDTNANLGGAPTRTFGSEIANLQEKGEDPKIQPEALHNIIGEATGVVNNHLDMIKGWNAIGGLGNRQANGYTLRPDDFARQFLDSHDINDYKDAAMKDMGPFKGMPGANTTTKSWKRVNGQLVLQ